MLKEPGKPFSKREAWLFLFSNLANGIERNGMPRGEFEASVRYLAKAWLWSIPRVHRFLCKLQAENMIQKVSPDRNADRNAQRNTPAERFSICNYALYQDSRNAQRNAQRNADRNKSNQRIKQSKIKEPSSPETGDMVNSFARFWIAYPRKVGKGAAEKAWSKIHPAADLLDLILASVELHKQSPDWIKDGGQYIPHPATYLNQRRWEDEVRQEESLHDQLFGKH